MLKKKQLVTVMMMKIEDKIKDRVAQLIEFTNKALESAPDEYGGVDWLEVPDSLFEKYGLNDEMISDKYYSGDAVWMVITELEKLIKPEA
jgi:hypothetical protein